MGHLHCCRIHVISCVASDFSLNIKNSCLKTDSLAKHAHEERESRVKCNSVEGVLFFSPSFYESRPPLDRHKSILRVRQRQRGRAVIELGLQFGCPEADAYRQLICSRFPVSKSSTTLVKSQLVRPRPVGILNPIMFDLKYLFQACARPHWY